ncbi:MAG: hypothetical protein AB7E96_05790 [Deferribacterales bacterium]
MKTEQTISKLMRTGVTASLILMVTGLLLPDDRIINLGVIILIMVPPISLVYFALIFFYNKEKKYALICLLIVLFLAAVTALKVFR